jgi:hypothetical protein
MGSQGESVLESGGPLPAAQPGARRISSSVPFSRQKHAIHAARARSRKGAWRNGSWGSTPVNACLFGRDRRAAAACLSHVVSIARYCSISFC